MRHSLGRQKDYVGWCIGIELLHAVYDVLLIGSSSGAPGGPPCPQDFCMAQCNSNTAAV